MEMPMQFNTYCFIFQNSLKILLFLLPSGGMGRITRNATPLMRIGRSIERNCSETQLLFARGEPSRYSAGRSHSQTVAERKVLLIPILLDEPFRSGFSIARPCKQMYIFCMCISFLRFALEGFATSRYSYYCSARLRSIYIVYRLHCRTCVILLWLVVRFCPGVCWIARLCWIYVVFLCFALQGSAGSPWSYDAFPPRDVLNLRIVFLCFALECSAESVSSHGALFPGGGAEWT